MNTIRSNQTAGVLAQIAEARRALLAGARESLNLPDQLLRLALNEAEALASQTLYPHLVFPELATEKIQNVAAWDRRQRVLNRQSRPVPF